MIKTIFNWLFNPCNHDWEIIDHQFFRTSYSCGEHVDFFNGKRVLMKCKKCGKLKKITL